MVWNLPSFFCHVPSIQSCELSRLDLKGVSLVSIVAGSWPLVCLTADVVDLCAKQTKTTTEFCEFCFAFWACLKDRKNSISFGNRSDFRSFAFFDVHDLTKSGPYRWQWAQERWRSCHSSTCFINQCMNSVMKSFGQVCHLLSSRCVCVLFV